jgi:hypothetical protein
MEVMHFHKKLVFKVTPSQAVAELSGVFHYGVKLDKLMQPELCQQDDFP